MNITILTYGTHGDVQPFVALALGLQRSGHRLRLAGPRRFEAFVAQHGVPFAPLPGDPQEMSARINDAQHNVMRAVTSTADYVSSIAAGVLRSAFAACDGADVIVHTFFFTTAAHSLARARGIADVSVQLLPLFAPTRAFPMPALPTLPRGVVSYLSHWFTMLGFRLGMNLGLRRLRHSEPGLLDFDISWPFDASQPRRTPLLFGHSPVVIPTPADWERPHIKVTGYFFLAAAADFQPPPELSDFLAAGEAPVCVTFGSMVNRESGRVGEIVRQTLACEGRRGVILTGWGSPKPDAGSDGVLYLDAAPHDWLLPRCSAVIHHGGAGTTAAGLRAGVPNIVVPHTIDQPFWGKRVAAIGAGPAPLSLDRLSVESLAASLARAGDPAMRRRAERIGGLIRAEDGVGRAVSLIEKETC